MTKSARAARATGGLVMIAGVVLLAFNLRPAVNALGVVLQEVQSSTGMSGTTAGMLTALPTLCFAVVGFAVAGVAARMGARRAVALSLIVLTVGQVLRATGSVWALFAGSVLALGAITFGNVLLPGLIRQHFPTAIGPMTALYTTVLMVGQSLGAGITLPLETALGGTWRLGIGMWAVTAAVAVVPWVAAALRRPATARGAATRGDPSGRAGDGGSARAREDTPGQVRDGAGAPIAMHRLALSPRAWAMAVFFGMQSLQAYVVFGWVPTVLTEAGMSVAGAGGVLAIITAVGIPISAVVPTLLGAVRRHGLFVIAFVSSLALGYVGLLFAPMTATWLQGLLIGFGLGSFPMVLMLFALRAHTHEGTTALSGFGQSVGYLLASIGPVGFGFLHEASHGSTVPLIAMLCTLVPMLIAGLVAVRDWRIEDDLAESRAHR